MANLRVIQFEETAWRFWLSFTLLILAIPLVPFAIFGDFPGQSWVEHPNSVYVFFAGMIVLCSDVFLPIPSSLVAIFLGARLGFLTGTIAIVFGLTLGSLVGYYSGWYFGYPFVQRHISDKQRQIITKLENRFSYLALALLRGVPVLAEASVLAAGAARLKTRPAMFVLTAANLALAVAYGIFGNLNQSSPSLLFLHAILIPLAVMVFVALMYFLSKFFALLL